VANQLPFAAPVTADADTPLSRARSALADASYRTGDFDAAEAVGNEALSEALAAGDRAGEAAALDLLGDLLHHRTIDLPRAEWSSVDFGVEQDLFERALAIRREIGDEAGVAESLLHLGWVHQVLRNQPAVSLPLFMEALTLAEPDGDPQVRSELHRHIGFHLAMVDNRPDLGLPHFQQSLELWRTGSEPARVIFALAALARCEAAAGHIDDALAHSQEALDLAARGSYRSRIASGAEAARRAAEEAAAKSG
jgi:tetratricopeptide (TPR) repeat protein